MAAGGGLLWDGALVDSIELAPDSPMVALNIPVGQCHLSAPWRAAR